MTSTTVAQFAAELKMPADVLLEQLKSAGVSKNSEADAVTEADKGKLLESLRKAHGSESGQKKITLTRKQTSEIKQAGPGGRARTVQVEVRKKRVFVQRAEKAGESEPVMEAQLEPAEQARRDAEAQRQAELKARQEAELKEKQAKLEQERERELKLQEEARQRAEEERLAHEAVEQAKAENAKPAKAEEETDTKDEAAQAARAEEAKAREHKPKLIVAGASAYSLHIDWARFAKVAKEIGAIFMVDMAHYAGLIAAGVYPNPVPFADVVTSTTHKSLRGPRGGIILMKAEHEKAINSAIFPGLQGGPLMHVIAAKAVAFKEAQAPEFKAYQEQVIKNAQVIAETLTQRGLRIVSGRTESHVMLVDLRAKGITGKEAEAVLGAAHMTINKNAIPNDPEKPFVTSGVRIGTPAMTTRGFKEEEARLTANLIADVLDNPRDEANIAAVRAKVHELTSRFPVYR